MKPGFFSSRQEALLLLGVLAVAAALRFYHLGHLSLWVDEGFGDWITRYTFAYLWNTLPTYETNPPLYYMLLKLWTALFGDSEAGMRSLSTVVNLCTIPVVFALGKMLAPGSRAAGWTGLLAASLFALSPIQLQ